MKNIIKEGDKYNKLTAIKFSHRDKNGCQYWFFKCDCGKEKIFSVNNIKTGHIKSCNCLSGKDFEHEMYGTRTYKSWQAMKNRCLNKNCIEYNNWGGRGITVCNEWLKFKNFYRDMGNRPEDKSIDRINNNGNYCKNNCKWSTQKEQTNNKRNNCFLLYMGKTKTISQWSVFLNIKYTTIWWRIRKGWKTEKALNNKPNKK